MCANRYQQLLPLPHVTIPFLIFNGISWKWDLDIGYTIQDIRRRKSGEGVTCSVFILRVGGIMGNLELNHRKNRFSSTTITIPHASQLRNKKFC